MPYYEFFCEACGIYFELTIKREIKLDEFICVDCAASQIKLLAFDQDLNIKITNLALELELITDRVQNLECHLEIEDPNDSRENKN